MSLYLPIVGGLSLLLASVAHSTEKPNILYDLRVDESERCNMADVEEYAELADWFRSKLGNIVLGDGRVEVNWKADNEYNISNFAPGADDKKLNIPRRLIPGVERARLLYDREFKAM